MYNFNCTKNRNKTRLWIIEFFETKSIIWQNWISCIEMLNLKTLTLPAKVTKILLTSNQANQTEQRRTQKWKTRKPLEEICKTNKTSTDHRSTLLIIGLSSSLSMGKDVLWTQVFVHRWRRRTKDDLKKTISSFFFMIALLTDHWTKVSTPFSFVE